jgi:hypothetical protein
LNASRASAVSIARGPLKTAVDRAVAAARSRCSADICLDLTMSMTLAWSAAARLDPLGRQSPRSNRSSATAPPAIEQALKAG